MIPEFVLLLILTGGGIGTFITIFGCVVGDLDFERWKVLYAVIPYSILVYWGYNVFGTSDTYTILQKHYAEIKEVKEEKFTDYVYMNPIRGEYERLTRMPNDISKWHVEIIQKEKDDKYGVFFTHAKETTTKLVEKK
jgi:hypothetical protein